ncbi:MAG TPA: hypothetical protein VEI02_12600 [Planctomycetota bacterium]|nr:hypothetical protein [Planctomycetota bacterium]
MPGATMADADLCLRLYEQRRERVLRRAREWFMEFRPRGYDDVVAVLEGREGRKAARYFRQATSYWEMVAAVMTSGAVSTEGRALFVETTREFFFVYAKLLPFLEAHRARTSPRFLRRLEEFCRSLPDHDALLDYVARMTGGAPSARDDGGKRRKG